MASSTAVAEPRPLLLPLVVSPAALTGVTAAAAVVLLRQWATGLGRSLDWTASGVAGGPQPEETAFRTVP